VEAAVTEGAHDHGSLGEEAQKLAEAVHEWISGPGAQWLDGRRAPGWLGESPECAVCPVCQLLRVVRGASPEVFGHLADAASSLSAAFRELLGDASPGSSSPRSRGGVEHIDLG
jgi:hypothetical protein